MPVGVVVLCFTLMLVGHGTLSTFPVFLPEMAAALPYSRSTLAGILSVSMLTGGLLSPAVGWLIDRFGPRLVILLGLGVASAGPVLAAASDTIAPFYAGLGLMAGFGFAALGPVTNAALIRRWWRRNTGTALGIVFSASGIGILIMAPLARILIEAVGWRWAFVGLGSTTAVMIPVVALLPWRRLTAGLPAPTGVDPTMPVLPAALAVDMAGAIHTRAFWGLFMVFLFTGTSTMCLNAHMVTLMVEEGIAPLKAATIFGISGALAPLGTVGFGWLADRFGNRRAAAASYSLTLIAASLLLPAAAGADPVLLTLVIGAFGLSAGSRAPIVAAIAARLVAGPGFGRIYGFVSMGGGIGSAIGIFAGGLAHDLTGSAHAIVWIAGGSAMLGALPFFTIRAIGRA